MVIHCIIIIYAAVDKVCVCAGMASNPQSSGGQVAVKNLIQLFFFKMAQLLIGCLFLCVPYCNNNTYCARF